METRGSASRSAGVQQEGWRSYLGAARTGSGGMFTFTADRTLSGYFRAVFPAQGYYLGSTSATRHLG
jgi:hypothetical protein